jgi:hypothetical protein
LCSAFGALFFLLSRQHQQIAAIHSTTQPAHGPILIPLESFNPGANDESHGFARLPAGGEPFVNVADRPVSSFAMNTDTASYDDLRRALFNDRIPTRESVRIESMINAFDYDYAAPVGNAAFSGQIEFGKCPWQADHRLARVAVKARSGAGTVAENVRTEVLFNPAQAKSYRLIGYDEVAGNSSRGEDVAAGHAVTALYEIVPATTGAPSLDMLTLRVHYREPDSLAEKLIQFIGRDPLDENLASADFRFAAAVAEFGLILRDPSRQKAANIDSVMQLAKDSRGPDVSGERMRFVDMVHHAKELFG